MLFNSYRQIIFIGTCVIFLASCRSSYYSLNDFNKVKKTDAHVHLDSYNKAFLLQATLDNFTLITINTNTGYPSINEQEDAAITSRNEFPGMVDYACSFDQAGWSEAGWSQKIIKKLDSSFAKGAKAVKFWKDIGMVYSKVDGGIIMIDDPRFDPIINHLQAKNIIMYGHFGEPKNCWLPVGQMTVNNDKQYFTQFPEYHMYLHPEFPSYEKQLEARDNMLLKHPGLYYIGCHLASEEWSVDALAKTLDKFPNISVDLAARICHLQYQSMASWKKTRNFIIKYQDRILYGTDLDTQLSKQDSILQRKLHETWLDDWIYFTSKKHLASPNVNGHFRGMKLPREIIDKIYFLNAQKLFRQEK